MKDLEEYYWNEITEHGEAVYLMLDKTYVTATISQPIAKHVPKLSTEQAYQATRDLYWGQLIVYCKTQL